MKHVYLIMAHGDFVLLKTLITMLDDARNDIYLHVDRKARLFNPDDFKTTQSKLIIIDKRLDVRWGDFSQIRLEMLLFETAYKNGPYAYYHLLSGVDLPLKSQDNIHDFFDRHQGKEFVGFWNDHDWQAELRVSRYYFFMRYERISNRLLSIIASKTRALLTLLCPKRKMECQFKKGPNWVSITQDFIEYLLSQKKWVLKRFRHTQNGDEIFLQTVLWNSAFRANLYSSSAGDVATMREVDWTRGSSTSPHIWTSADFPRLLSSHCLFARKFSSDIDSKVIESISAHNSPKA